MISYSFLPLPPDLVSVVCNEQRCRHLRSHRSLYSYVLPKLLRYTDRWEINNHGHGFPKRVRLYKCGPFWMYRSFILNPYRQRPSIDEELTQDKIYQQKYLMDNLNRET
jgi:hypothetical protein